MPRSRPRFEREPLAGAVGGTLLAALGAGSATVPSYPSAPAAIGTNGPPRSGSGSAADILGLSLPFLATGLSHHLAPLPVREQLHLDDVQIVESLRALVGHAGLTGAVCLSTCNRTEFYLTTRDDRHSQ
jgi:hypothetical protein